MADANSNFESTRKLLNAFVQVLQEFPDALKGSGAKIASASEENQPLSSSEISGINSRLRDDEESITKLEEKLQAKRAERDADLIAKACVRRGSGCNSTIRINHIRCGNCLRS